MNYWHTALLIVGILFAVGGWESWRAHNRAQEDAPNHPGEM